MKRLTATILAVLLLAVGCMPLAAADVRRQDGLEVDFHTERQSYGVADTIVGELSFRNVGFAQIDDIAYELVSPAGYLLDGQTGPVSVGTLSPAESSVRRISLTRVNAALPQTGDSSSFAGALTAFFTSVGILLVLLASRKRGCHRFLSLVLCAALMSSAFAGIPASSFAEASGTRSMIVEQNVSIGGKDTVLRVLVTYSAQTLYTRAEWLAMLIHDAGVDAVELQGSASYADIAGTRYQEEIETAVAVGILTPDSENECFYPDAPATRDFAAAMAVRVLGFIANPENVLHTGDASRIEYQTEAYIAVQQGMLSLEDGLYVPQRAINESEAGSIRAVFGDILDSTTVTEDGGAGITYQSGVFEVSTGDYADQNSVLTLPESAMPDGAGVGSIIVLNGDNAYRILSISRSAGMVSLRYEEPELNEFIEEIDIHGFLRGEASSFVPAEGVTVSTEQPIARYGARLGNASSGLFGSLKLSGNKTLSNGSKFFYEVSISIPEASFNFDGNLWTMDIRNFYVSISPQVTAEFTWGRDYESPTPIPKERFLLGEIPLFGIKGAGVLIEFYIAVQADGKIGVEMNIESLMGFQVYNNQPRAFGNLDMNIMPRASGKFAIGPNFYLVAQLARKNLIGFGGFLAGYLEGTAKWRVDENTCCIDGGIGALLEIDMGDCLVRKLPVLKNQSLTWEIFKHNLFSGHVEITGRGIQVVDECTLNRGTLRGIVAQALNRTSYISGAQIVLTGPDGRVQTETSGSTGGYTIVTKEGDYKLRVSKAGYIPFETDITVIAGDTNVVETLLMVEGEENDSRQGIIGGTITNAKTGQTISGATIEIRKGWNKTNGAVVKTVYTNGNGQYEATLQLGNYTLQLKKDGFITAAINVAVSHNTDRSHHGAMVPEKGGPEQEPEDRLSIVLTWGEKPSDLDSHLRGYSAQGGEMFHTYYSNKSYYVNSGKQVFLDLDDVTSYGPETTTVMGMKNGEKYSFFVHDFTNRGSSYSNALANSGAKVAVYKGVRLVREFNVPAQTGTVWHVFDYDVTTDTLTAVNAFTSTGNAGQVGARMSTFNLRSTISPDKE